MIQNHSLQDFDLHGQAKLSRHVMLHEVAAHDSIHCKSNVYSGSDTSSQSCLMMHE